MHADYRRKQTVGTTVSAAVQLARLHVSAANGRPTCLHTASHSEAFHLGCTSISKTPLFASEGAPLCRSLAHCQHTSTPSHIFTAVYHVQYKIQLWIILKFYMTMNATSCQQMSSFEWPASQGFSYTGSLYLLLKLKSNTKV